MYGQKKKRDDFQKQYGGTGALNDVTSPSGHTVHDTFKDVMTGKERTVADWKREIAPMRQRAAQFRKDHEEKTRWGRRR